MSSVDIIVFTSKTVVNTTFQNVLKDYKYKKDIGKTYKSALNVKMIPHYQWSCFTVYLKFGEEKYTILKYVMKELFVLSQRVPDGFS